MDLLQDPRKIFLNGFSRGAADIFHAVKKFTPAQKKRLIITVCGPIMILPRNLGFKVTNLISNEDWYSISCILHDLEILKHSDVRFLKSKDSNGAMFDHFFQSKTYQEGLKEHCLEDYKEYGILK
jgi:hypothetical protein